MALQLRPMGRGTGTTALDSSHCPRTVFQPLSPSDKVTRTHVLQDVGVSMLFDPACRRVDVVLN